MDRRVVSRLRASILALLLTLVMIPSLAFAEDGDVAKIGDTTYTSLAGAVAAAQDGDTIELLDTTWLEETLVVEKKVTLDLGTNSVKAAFTTNEKNPLIKVTGDSRFYLKGNMDGSAGTLR